MGVAFTMSGTQRVAILYPLQPRDSANGLLEGQDFSLPRGTSGATVAVQEPRLCQSLTGARP